MNQILRGQGRVYHGDVYLATVEYQLTTRQTIDGLLDTAAELRVIAGQRDLDLGMQILTLQTANDERYGLVITDSDITCGRYQAKVNR